MSTKTALKVLFAGILVTMVICTGYASVQQPIFRYGGLTTGPDRYWTIATLFDAYFAFLTFYVWVLYKEPKWLPRVAWFIAIMALGNMAMAAYVLIQLFRLRGDQPVSAMLGTRNG